MKLYGACFSLILVFSAPLLADGEPPVSASTVNTTEIIDRYVKALEAERDHPQLSMEVDMDAKLPKLKKEGRLHALRFITRFGKIFYDGQKFEGDNTIKKEVIARYIQAEKDGRGNSDGSISVTPANYKFRYKGMTDYAGRPAHVFQVTPKKKRVQFYKGELWIDQETSLPLREWGELSKSPSVFLKNIYFVRDYVIMGGMSVPRRVISDIQTRIAGRAQLTIWYENIKVGESQPTTASNASAGMLGAGTNP